MKVIDCFNFLKANAPCTIMVFFLPNIFVNFLFFGRKSKYSIISGVYDLACNFTDEFHLRGLFSCDRLLIYCRKHASSDLGRTNYLVTNATLSRYLESSSCRSMGALI